MECFKDVLFRRVNIYHIICLGLLLRVVGLIQTGYIRVDGTIYVKIGESFSKGEFADAFRGAFPPVYPFFIGLFHLLIPDLELAGNLVSFVFGVILIYIVFVFVKKFFGSQYALLASFFVAIHPFLVRNSVTVLSESVATLLFALSVFFYYRGWTEEQTGDVALSGIFLGLTYLTRPEYVVYAVPHGHPAPLQEEVFPECHLPSLFSGFRYSLHRLLKGGNRSMGIEPESHSCYEQTPCRWLFPVPFSYSSHKCGFSPHTVCGLSFL